MSKDRHEKRDWNHEKSRDVITINPDNSDPFDITLEVKAGKFTMDGKESLLLQLNEAMEIRKAKAGIAVADIEYAGKTHNDVVRRVGRNRYVVLVDRKNQDFAPVKQCIGHLEKL